MILTREMKIVKASKKYAESYCTTMDLVSREKKFLSNSKGVPLEQILNFMQICKRCDYPEFFLLNENREVVGWCDIVRRADQPPDVGYLGIGILKEYRGVGWGTRLIDKAVNLAASRGFDEIRLEVRASNENAIRTYKRFGFVTIKLLKDGVVTDGVSEDVWVMSYTLSNIISDNFSRRDFFSTFPKINYRFEPDKEEN